MVRNLNEAEIIMATCYQTMSAWDFNYARRQEWIIWAARHRRCPTCSSPPHSPCVNMADKKAGKTPRINKQPHDLRIDWGRLLEGLKRRGYYRANIEAKIRRAAENRTSLEEDDILENRPKPDWA